MTRGTRGRPRPPNLEFNGDMGSARVRGSPHSVALCTAVTEEAEVGRHRDCGCGVPVGVCVPDVRVGSKTRDRPKDIMASLKSLLQNRSRYRAFQSKKLVCEHKRTKNAKYASVVRLQIQQSWYGMRSTVTGQVWFASDELFDSGPLSVGPHQTLVSECETGK